MAERQRKSATVVCWEACQSFEERHMMELMVVFNNAMIADRFVADLAIHRKKVGKVFVCLAKSDWLGY